MSGQLVGEVIAASAALRERGVPERGFHALIAIAEKAAADSRQASVRWDHIRDALYGASLSTAKRAIADLKVAGVIRVVKRGFDNQNGRSAAPIYEIQQITERVTQVTHSADDRTGHPGDTFDGGRTGHPGDTFDGGRTGQIADRTGHPGDLLDGSTDGTDEWLPNWGTSPSAAGYAANAPDRQPANAPKFIRGPYGHRCRRHGHLKTPPDGCLDCATIPPQEEP